MPSLSEKTLSHEDLLFDPNNYRFQDAPDFVYANEIRFHESGVQERVNKRLRADEGLLLLKNSLLSNGFIPIERIIVRAYDPLPDKYLVVEGNRRLAAIRWIIDDQQAGVDIPAELLESFRQLSVVVIEGNHQLDKTFQAALMGIRHVSGIKEWGGYQRAKLVASLRDEHNLETGQIADRVGMTAHEVNRRYRAFKALQQMQEDEEYEGYAKPEMYPLFHEAVSLPVVREWLGWDDGQLRFTKQDELEQFYDLLSPTALDEGIAGDAKVTTYAQVRELRYIIPSPEARQILLDPARSFFDAVAVAKSTELSQAWVAKVSAAVRALESMGVSELKALSEENKAELEKLRDLIQERLVDYSELRPS
jgi:hypothetical protein